MKSLFLVLKTLFVIALTFVGMFFLAAFFAPSLVEAFLPLYSVLVGGEALTDAQLLEQLEARVILSVGFLVPATFLVFAGSKIVAKRQKVEAQPKVHMSKVEKLQAAEAAKAAKNKAKADAQIAKARSADDKAAKKVSAKKTKIEAKKVSAAKKAQAALAHNQWKIDRLQKGLPTHLTKSEKAAVKAEKIKAKQQKELKRTQAKLEALQSGKKVNLFTTIKSKLPKVSLPKVSLPKVKLPKINVKFPKLPKIFGRKKVAKVPVSAPATVVPVAAVKPVVAPVTPVVQPKVEAPAPVVEPTPVAAPAPIKAAPIAAPKPANLRDKLRNKYNRQ
jgi:hypothetical protein